MKQRLCLQLLLVVLLAMSATANAGTREGGASMTLNAGAFVFDGMEKLNAGPEIGARIGYDIHKAIGLEGSFGFIDTSPSTGYGQVYGYTYRADVLVYLLPDSKFVPFLAAGIGGMSLINSPVYGNRNSLLLDYGLGAKYFVADSVAIRADARGLATYDTNAHGHGEVTLGLNYYFGRGREMAALKPVAMVEPEPVQVVRHSVVEPAIDPAPASQTPAPVATDDHVAVQATASVPVKEVVSIPVQAATSVTAPAPAAAPVTAAVTVSAAAPVTAAVTAPVATPVHVIAPVPAILPVAKPVVASQQPSGGSCDSCKVRTVTNVDLEKNSVEIIADLEIDSYKTFILDKPSRLVIDICCAVNGIAGKTSHVAVNRKGISSVRVGHHPGKLRVVLDSTKRKFPAYRLEKSSRGLKVVLI